MVCGEGPFAASRPVHLLCCNDHHKNAISATMKGTNLKPSAECMDGISAAQLFAHLKMPKLCYECTRVKTEGIHAKPIQNAYEPLFE